MKRFLFLLVCCCAIADNDLDEQRQAVLKFEFHYDRYVRSLYGCHDSGEINEFTCHPGAGVLDYKEFELAREAAKKLFGIKETK